MQPGEKCHWYDDAPFFWVNTGKYRKTLVILSNDSNVKFLSMFSPKTHQRFVQNSFWPSLENFLPSPFCKLCLQGAGFEFFLSSLETADSNQRLTQSEIYV